MLIRTSSSTRVYERTCRRISNSVVMMMMITFQLGYVSKSLGLTKKAE